MGAGQVGVPGAALKVRVEPWGSGDRGAASSMHLHEQGGGFLEFRLFLCVGRLKNDSGFGVPHGERPGAHPAQLAYD